MALKLNKTGITNGSTVQAYHVTQSIDAFTGTIAYDISLSGSFNLTGSVTSGTPDNIANSFSHAEGQANQATGYISHAEGLNNFAVSIASHAEGIRTLALGSGSHAEGYATTSSGESSHAEGSGSLSSGPHSHAEGILTSTLGTGSHAEGWGTIASGSFQHTQGRYNTHGDTTSLLIVGNGVDDNTRKDAFKVRMSGSIVLPTTQSAAPTWTGTNGEIVPATVGGVHRLYMWMAGAWRSSSFA